MSSFSQDAVQTDGDKYKVLLENDCVRVLDYRDAARRRDAAAYACRPSFYMR